MSGLTITDSGLASVEVTFRIDSNGMLQVNKRKSRGKGSYKGQELLPNMQIAGWNRIRC